VTDRSPLLFLLFAGPVRLAGRLIPFLIAIALVVVANLPISFTGGLLPAPVLALAAIYFWALARPALMPPYAVLVIGLAEDLLSGGPPGLWATGFLAGYALIDRQRKDLGELNGAGNLFAFTGVMLVSALTAYLLASAMFMRLLPLPPLLLEGIVTVALYPLLERPLDWADRSITRFLRSG
jgi:rod shape-determining protein MreD